MEYSLIGVLILSIMCKKISKFSTVSINVIANINEILKISLKVKRLYV